MYTHRSDKPRTDVGVIKAVLSQYCGANVGVEFNKILQLIVISQLIER